MACKQRAHRELISGGDPPDQRFIRCCTVEGTIARRRPRRRCGGGFCVGESDRHGGSPVITSHPTNSVADKKLQGLRSIKEPRRRRVFAATVKAGHAKRGGGLLRPGFRAAGRRTLEERR